MLRLLDIFGFLSVVLRGLVLALQSMTGGGLVFAVLVARGEGGAAAARACRRLLIGCALALALIEGAYLAAESAILMGTADLRLAQVIGANFFLAGGAAALLALTIALLATLATVTTPARKAPTATTPTPAPNPTTETPAPATSRSPATPWAPGPGRRAQAALGAALLLWLGILAASVATSHAAARLEARALPLALTALHQAATACWIGGLPYLLLTLARTPDTVAARPLVARFSLLAQASVAALFAGGVGLALIYINNPEAILGTAYGAMVGTKIVLFGLLLGLGALNYGIARQVGGDGTLQPADHTQPDHARPDASFGTSGSKLLSRLRRFAEAEVGIGFTVILTAASLTSQPPAADLVRDQVPLTVIAARMTPRAPRLVPPPRQEMMAPSWRAVAAANGGHIPDSYVSFVPGQIVDPPTPAEIALSEFNHNVAGLMVLIAGLLAVAARAGWRWARNWPLAFLGLAVFLFLLADVEYWPMGPVPFWRGFLVSEVVQHRFAVLLIVAFAVFERQVQTGRAGLPAMALVFPFVCFLGGALLLTHSHSLNNPKEELLAELSHIAIAILGIAAGWSRWLELRLATGPRRALSWVWPICLILVGAVLLNYRES
jgi:putative copper resistance protein D